MAVRWYTHIFIHEYKGKYVHSIFNDRDLNFDIGDVQAQLLFFLGGGGGIFSDNNIQIHSQPSCAKFFGPLYLGVSFA